MKTNETPFKCPYNDHSCLYVNTCGMSVDKSCKECERYRPQETKQKGKSGHLLSKRSLLVLLIVVCTATVTGTLKRHSTPEDIYRWDCVYWAIAAVESNFNHMAIGSKGDGGIIQIMPEGSGGYLDEANRLLRERRYTDKDRFCPVKSREIWEVVMKYRNPDKSLSKAIKLHNPGAGRLYSKRVQEKYEEFTLKLTNKK